MGAASQLIAAERARQMSGEGYSHDHDDDHVIGELTAAAFCYAWHAAGWLQSAPDETPKWWPWVDGWKPKDPASDFVRAGALCQADIERAERAGDEPDELSKALLGFVIDRIDRAGCSTHSGPIGHLVRQHLFSLKTFGPGARTAGVINHIRKELCEIEAEPGDAQEWADVIILGFDGAWRAGWTPREILEAIVAKQRKNEGRNWPDWRLAPTDKAIEHIRGAEA